MSYLEGLLASTRTRIDELRAASTLEELECMAQRAEPPRDFRPALTSPGVAIIAEIKRASPRTGTLVPSVDAAAIAGSYAAGGASAISVLTEPDGFHGAVSDLEDARAAGLPLLGKDFILDEIQILESRTAGADAVLLIARALGGELARLISLCEELDMDALVEVFDELDLERATSAGATLIGVNQRDLETFEIDPYRTAKLAPLLPAGSTLVALSGISTRAQIEMLEQLGADAALVGEALITATDPAEKLRELRGST
jgi:indole-3-glycerol phosphate synthase